MKNKDWIGLIEAGYHLESDDEIWVKNIYNQAVLFLDIDNWPVTAMWRYTPISIKMEHIITNGPAPIIQYIEETTKANEEVVDLMYRDGKPILSLSESVFPQYPEEQMPLMNQIPGQMQDIIGVRAYSGNGTALGTILGFSKDAIKPTELERKRWSNITSHWGAGLRLRSIAKSLSLDSNHIEAVFDSGGRLYDARQEAKKQSYRETLRRAVYQIETARTRDGRNDPDAAMKSWEGLVEGRWSLVDYFDTDNRRFVIAIKNDPAYPDLRGLTIQERQVAEFVGLGHSSKEISYTLGISQSSATNCILHIKHKLKLQSHTELVTFFSPSGLRAKLAEISLAGEELLVGAYPLINEDCIKMLTQTERQVLTYLLAGSTNSDIAQRRNTSDRTVANQIQSIFRKLGVSSRGQLAARLQNTR